MSITTRGRRAAAPAPVEPGLTFARAVHAEWLKLVSLRSSFVLLAITLAAMAGIGLLSAYALIAMAEGGIVIDEQGGPVSAEGMAGDLSVMAHAIPSSGLAVAQFLIASLAVMMIGAEYGTRMISTTLTVVPRRVTALTAKLLVIAGTSFIVGVAGAFASYFAVQPLLAPHGLDFALSADGVPASILATGAYLALIAALGLGLGGLLRNSAGGIMATLGLLLVLPVVAAIAAGQNEFVQDASEYLPSAAGIQMVAIETLPDTLTQVQGGLVVLAWAAVALAGALVTVKRRDA